MALAVVALAVVEAVDLQLAHHAVVVKPLDRMLLPLALAGPQALLSVVIVTVELAILLLGVRMRPSLVAAARHAWARASPATMAALAATVVFLGLSWVKEYRFQRHYAARAYDATDDVGIIMATLNITITVVVLLASVGVGAVAWRAATKAREPARQRWLHVSATVIWGAVASLEYLFVTREAQFLPNEARVLGGVVLILTTQSWAAILWPVEAKLTRRANMAILAGFLCTVASLRLSSPPFFNLRQTLIERARHAGATFELLSSVLDFDQDGVPSLLGGSDCDDLNADISPLAMDAPDDGIDQNCTGADSTMRPGVGAVALPTEPALPAHEPWNVLWIVVDALRADRVGRVIDGRSITPHLDGLSATSVVFDHARATSTHTMESFPSMLSGRFPTYLLRRGEHIDPRSMLASQLALHDYVTAFVTPIPNLPPIVKAGFMVFDDQQSWGRDYLHSVTAGPVTKTCVALIKPRERPFFVVAHYFDPHGAFIRHKEFDFGDSEEQRYDAEVAATDVAIGALLAHVTEIGLLERTVVVVTADHGTAFGEHGETGHGRLPYEEAARVPLIVRVPGLTPRIVSTPVSLIDLMPTMLQLTGIADPGHLQGTSLVPLMTGTSDVENPTFHEVNTGKGTWRAAVKGDLKYIYGPQNNIEILFDLSADPLELDNIAASHPQRAEMRALVDTFRDDWLDAAPFAEPIPR